MRFPALLLATAAILSGAPALAREAVDASAPNKLAVTLYRDPDRGVDQPMNTNWPQGFAMISETRQVTLPPGESTIRFEGVAEGMVAVTAIVTGLPGGTIEKNRNADLLSPAALVDGTLGNRVTITRTNPATGTEQRESAVVHTRADGGLVLQTSAGYEAVRCSGLPEKLTFDRVPAGLSAQPVFSIDTRDDRGGTYTVTLTYLAWGFDWQAHYVATLDEGGKGGDIKMRLMSWLTLLNDNGQSFPDADLMVVAGKLNVESDYRALSDPPAANPLRLVCYPLGHTADGSDYYDEVYPGAPPPPAPPPPPVALMAQSIVVTGSRMKAMDVAAPAMVATEEDLGDLKLYRVPEPVTVSAKGLKQVAFLDRRGVKGELLYTTSCHPWDYQQDGEYRPANMLLTTVNDARHGLGVALPTGAITVFEPTAYGDLLAGEERLRDYASGQDVEIEMGQSTQVFATCEVVGREPKYDHGERIAMRVRLTNANRSSAKVRLSLTAGGENTVVGLKGLRTKDGVRVADIDIPASGTREIRFTYVLD